MANDIALVENVKTAEKRPSLKDRLVELMKDAAGRKFLERVAMLEADDRALVDQVLRLDNYGKERTAAYIKIELIQAGCFTPAETFIANLVEYSGICGLTPDQAEVELRDFRRDFEAMNEAAVRFCQGYPAARKEVESAPRPSIQKQA